MFHKTYSIRKSVFSSSLIPALFIVFVAAQAQPEQKKLEQYQLDQAQVTRTQLSQRMDSAVALLDAGEYALADVKFRVLLKNMKSVPSDFTFYFGKNSYYVGKYKQSIDWVNKYIELKGTTGRFYEESVNLLKKAESAFLQEKQQQVENTGAVLSRNYDIDCGPTGKVICPVCKGSTVLIKKGPFGNEYNTCPYCDSHGLLTCAQYNLLIRGELKPGSTSN